MSFLSGDNMVGGYGGADILKGCTIDVNEGEIAVIVGPNGAGKSTAMKALLGMLELKQGKVSFRGKDISQLTPQARVAEGFHVAAGRAGTAIAGKGEEESHIVPVHGRILHQHGPFLSIVE